MSILCSMVGASFTVAAAAEILRQKKSVIAGGNGQIDTAQSKFGGSSYLGDGTGDYLSVQPLTNFAFGTGDFTIEFWFRINTTVVANTILLDARPAGGNGAYPAIYIPSNTLAYYANSSNQITGATTLSANTWYHVALSRSAGSTKLFLNGTQQGSTYTDSTNYVEPSLFVIGAQSYTIGASSLNGWMEEIRVSNTARYTANFTAPTAQFTNDANTLLLIHADGTDASTFFEDDNGLTRAPINAWQPESGVVISSTQSKFGGTSLYTPGGATLYHSQYSGASNGNALINFGTGDFTLEFWIYPTSTATTSGVITKRNNTSTANGTWGIYYNGSTRTVNWQNIFPSVTTTSTTTSIFSLNAWSHWAFVRSSGTFKIYIDGVERASASNSLDFTFNSEPIRIGDWDTGAGNGHIGYLDEIRMSNSARYTSAFVPSTTPFVNDANTLLLMHMNGTPSVAVFRDDNGALANRKEKYISTFGNAQVDTAQSKFGGSSALFDGTGDYLLASYDATTVRWSTNTDYTLEYWIRPNSMTNFETGSGTKLATTIGQSTPGGTASYWDFGPLNDGSVRFYYYSGSEQFITTTGVTLTTGNWYHLAFVKSGTSIKIYVNGTERASGTVTGTPQYNTDPISIGQYNNISINAWLDEIRISNSARYTSAFTPSTTPFVNDANTLFLMHADGADASTAFFDDTGSRTQKGIQAIGNAQIDTAQSKFGGASLLGDGTGDYLQLPTDPTLTLAGDFTVECWYRIPSTVPSILPFYTSDHLFYLTNDAGTAKYAIFAAGANRLLTSGVTVSATTWYHVAFVRSGSTVTAYHNGTSAGSTTYSNTILNTTPTIGSYSSSFINGHYDEFRISNSARYTANFTPSTTPFQNDANTVLLLHMDGQDASTTFIDDNGIAPYTP